MPKEPPSALGVPLPTYHTRVTPTNSEIENLIRELLKELRDFHRDFRVVFGGYKKDG